MNLTYNINQEKEILECFNKNGVVIVTGVLNKQECIDTLRDLDLPINCDLTDPSTYDKLDDVVNRYGVYGKTALFTKALLTNRTHSNVQKIFKLLYGTDQLLVQHDRIGIMRPTTGKFGNEKWRVPDNYPNLHLDINIFGYFKKNLRNEVDNFFANLEYRDPDNFIAENNVKHYTMGRHIQAVLNLVNNRYEDGGFQCVPLENPQTLLENWVSKMTGNAEVNGRYIFSGNKNEQEILQYDTTRTPCPAGSLILFDALLPHGTLPNFSDRIRVVQFIRYIPKEIIINSKKRAKLVKEYCEKVGFELNENNIKVLLGDE